MHTSLCRRTSSSSSFATHIRTRSVLSTTNMMAWTSLVKEIQQVHNRVVKGGFTKKAYSRKSKDIGHCLLLGKVLRFGLLTVVLTVSASHGLQDDAVVDTLLWSNSNTAGATTTNSDKTVAYLTRSSAPRARGISTVRTCRRW